MGDHRVAKRQPLPTPVNLEQIYQHDMAQSLRELVDLLSRPVPTPVPGTAELREPDEGELRKRLTKIKGVGGKTADEIIEAVKS